MSAYDDMKAEIAKLGDEDAKKLMNSLLSTINVEKGTALTDLKAQKDIVNAQKGDIKTLADLAKAFKDAGVKVESNEQMVEIAKQFNVKMDDKDSLSELNKVVTEREATIKEQATKLKAIEVERTMIPLLEAARKEFKDDDGKQIHVMDMFIDKKALVDVDITQEVLVNKKINDVLLEGQVKTVALMKDEGLDRTGADTHSLHNQDTGIKNRSQGITQETLNKDWDRENATRGINQVASQIAALRESREQTE